MDTHKNTSTRTKYSVRTGDILLAKPFWLEEEYKRSVVLIWDNDKTGSKGLILNKISNLLVHDALPEFNLYYPLYYGGDTKTNEVNYIHNFPNLPDVEALGNGLYIGGAPESLQALIQTNMINSSSVKFCAGFIEWMPGALDEELEENKWWKSDINAQELFTMPSDRLWSYKLLNTGHLYGIFDNCDDPSLN